MEKARQVKFVLRISSELHERIVRLGEENLRSLNNQILVILASWFDPKALRDRAEELERTA